MSAGYLVTYTETTTGKQRQLWYRRLTRANDKAELLLKHPDFYEDVSVGPAEL